MSFGIPRGADGEGLTYGSYLKVSELTNLQTLLSDPPQHDEMLFIIIHQVFELWFKQLIHELDTVVSLLQANDPLGVHRLLRRCIEIERVLVSQISVLETMTPVDFLNFRDRLNPASGFQSAQFREVEITSGIRDARCLRNYPPDSPERQRLEARLARPSVREGFYQLLRERGFNVTMPADGESEETVRARMLELARIYHEAGKNYELYLLAESMIEYDEMFAMWRLRHVKMVERMIGSKTGTGGSEGASYLWATVTKKFFPELWEMRSYLSKRTAGY